MEAVLILLLWWRNACGFIVMTLGGVGRKLLSEDAGKRELLLGRFFLGFSGGRHLNGQFWLDSAWESVETMHVCSDSQPCPDLCNSTGCSPPGSSVHGVIPARILEWVDFRGSSWPMIEPTSPESPALAGGVFTAVPPRRGRVLKGSPLKVRNILGAARFFWAKHSIVLCRSPYAGAWGSFLLETQRDAERPGQHLELQGMEWECLKENFMLGKLHVSEVLLRPCRQTLMTRIRTARWLSCWADGILALARDF